MFLSILLTLNTIYLYWQFSNLYLKSGFSYSSISTAYMSSPLTWHFKINMSNTELLLFLFTIKKTYTSSDLWLLMAISSLQMLKLKSRSHPCFCHIPFPFYQEVTLPLSSKYTQNQTICHQLYRLYHLNQWYRIPSAVQQAWVWSLNWDDPLEKGMATHPVQYSSLENSMDREA